VRNSSLDNEQLEPTPTLSFRGFVTSCEALQPSNLRTRSSCDTSGHRYYAVPQARLRTLEDIERSRGEQGGRCPTASPLSATQKTPVPPMPEAQGAPPSRAGPSASTQGKRRRARAPSQARVQFGRGNEALDSRPPASLLPGAREVSAFPPSADGSTSTKGKGAEPQSSSIRPSCSTRQGKRRPQTLGPLLPSPPPNAVKRRTLRSNSPGLSPAKEEKQVTFQPYTRSTIIDSTGKTTIIESFILVQNTKTLDWMISFGSTDMPPQS
jgi:hypothetical protein